MRFDVTVRENDPDRFDWLFGSRWYWDVKSEHWPRTDGHRDSGFTRTRAKAMRKARRAARRIEARTGRTARLAYLEYNYDSQDLNP